MLNKKWKSYLRLTISLLIIFSTFPLNIYAQEDEISNEIMVDNKTIYLRDSFKHTGYSSDYGLKTWVIKVDYDAKCYNIGCMKSLGDHYVFARADNSYHPEIGMGNYMLLMIRVRENGSISKEITSFNNVCRDKIISPSTYIYLEKESNQSPTINSKSNGDVEIILCFTNRDFGIVNKIDSLEGSF